MALTTPPPLLPLSCQEYIVTPLPLIKHLLHTPNSYCYINFKTSTIKFLDKTESIFTNHFLVS